MTLPCRHAATTKMPSWSPPLHIAFMGKVGSGDEFKNWVSYKVSLSFVFSIL
jgi:hypothetical protein